MTAANALAPLSFYLWQTTSSTASYAASGSWELPELQGDKADMIFTMPQNQDLLRGCAPKNDVKFIHLLKQVMTPESLGSDSCNQPQATPPYSHLLLSHLPSAPSCSQVGQKGQDFRPLGKLRLSPKGLEKATDTEMSVQDTRLQGDSWKGTMDWQTLSLSSVSQMPPVRSGVLRACLFRPSEWHHGPILVHEKACFFSSVWEDGNREEWVGCSASSDHHSRSFSPSLSPRNTIQVCCVWFTFTEAFKDNRCGFCAITS